MQFKGNPDAGVIYDESALTVQFVPFNGSGQVPKPVPPTRPARGAGN